LPRRNGGALDDALTSRTLGEVAAHLRTCPYCGAAYELPPAYVSGENLAFQTVHPMDRETRRPTGQVIIVVANVRVHECWHDKPEGQG